MLRVNAWSNIKVITGISLDLSIVLSDFISSYCLLKTLSDDDEVATFFPVHKRKPRRKQLKNKEELDTFSIQEMTIIESDSNDGDKSSDEEDCDSQLNLELPPRNNDSFMNKLRQTLCCNRSAQGIF